MSLWIWNSHMNMLGKFSTGALFLTLPDLPCSPHIDLKAEKNVEFARNLKEHSVLYRILQYVLV